MASYGSYNIDIDYDYKRFYNAFKSFPYHLTYRQLTSKYYYAWIMRTRMKSHNRQLCSAAVLSHYLDQQMHKIGALHHTPLLIGHTHACVTPIICECILTLSPTAWLLSVCICITNPGIITINNKFSVFQNAVLLCLG